MITRVIKPDLRKMNAKRFLPELFKRLRQAGEIVARDLKTYPPQRPGRRMKFKTPRQARFVRFAVKTGIMEVPYRRTGHLGSAWSVKGPYRKGRQMRVEVYNDPSLAPYARYVQSDAEQTEFHEEGGWKTPKQVIEKRADEIVRNITKVFR